MNIWPAAIHESGHAVVCQLAGGTVKHIRLFNEPTLDTHGRIITGARIVVPTRPLLRAMVLLAGPIAERMVVGDRDWRIPAKVYLDATRRLLFENGLDFEAVWCRAEVLVDRYRPRIVQLASLLEHERAVEGLGPLE